MAGRKTKFAQINRGKTEIFSNYKMVNLNFSQITGGEIFHEGLKQKNLQFTRMKFKKNILQR